MNLRVNAPVRVINPDGGFAVGEGEIVAFRFDGEVVVRLSDGREVWVARELLRELPQETEPQRKAADVVDRMIAYEAGNLSEDEVIELFQELVKTGVAWKLQGRYGRTARALIAAGFVTE